MDQADPRFRRHRWVRWGPTVAALAVAFLAASGTEASARGDGPSPGQPPGEPEICVIAPRLQVDRRGRVSGQVPTAKPTLVVREALAEVRIERGGRPVWRALMPADAPAGLPLAWPLAPLGPGEGVVMRLRPQGLADSAFASVRIQGAPAAVLRSSESLVRNLGANPGAWEAAVDRALETGQFPLAWALLFDPRAPAARGLQELRAELLARGCGPDRG